MKKSNKLILLLSVLFIIGLVFSDFVLKGEYNKIDLSNTFKNYQSVKVPGFSAVEVKGGNGYAIKFVGGKAFDVKVMTSRLEFLKYSVKDSLLSIQFNVPRINLQNTNLKYVPVGLIITCPSLPVLTATDTYNLIDSLSADSMRFIAKGSSFTRMRKNTINRFSVTAQNGTYTEFSEGNTANQLSLELSDSAMLRMNDTKFSQFNPALTGKAEIILSGTSVGQLHYNK